MVYKITRKVLSANSLDSNMITKKNDDSCVWCVSCAQLLQMNMAVA